MTLGIVVITNKSVLPISFIRRLAFADKVLFVHESEKPKLDLPLKNAKFLATDPKNNFAQKRNEGLKNINTDWVLFVDDDETISDDLAKEITHSIVKSKFAGYYLTRRDICFYQELKHGEIKDQKILRLARSGSGNFRRSVHEVWSIEGEKGYLASPLYHQKDNFIAQFINKIRQYGPLDADSLNTENKPFNYFRLLFYPKLKFLNNYFLKQGFRDGLPGLFLAYLMSIQSLSVRIYQWEKTLK